MIEFRKCYPEHIECIVVQDVQTGEQSGLLTADAAAVVQSSVALSAWHGGRCLGAAGLVPVWAGRTLAWALLSKYAPPFMLPITRHIRFVLDTYPAKRIEMVVLNSFPQGHRWARALGFVNETPNGMRAFLPDGSDGAMYARVKP